LYYFICDITNCFHIISSRPECFGSFFIPLKIISNICIIRSIAFLKSDFMTYFKAENNVLMYKINLSLPKSTRSRRMTSPCCIHSFPFLAKIFLLFFSAVSVDIFNLI
jgi:hypothetical protein